MTASSLEPVIGELHRPFTDSELAHIPRVRPNIRALRRRLKIRPTEFAQAFGFNVSTLRDWEQGRYAPDQAVRSFLRVIAIDPNHVRKKILEPA